MFPIMGDDDNPTIYPQLAEKGCTANNWEPAALHNCTKDRLLGIARDFELEICCVVERTQLAFSMSLLR